MIAPKFTIKHIGINNRDGKEAEKLLRIILALFGLERGDENDSHVFAGNLFEIMKNEKYGAKGHIALQTSDVEYAIAYFGEKGVEIKAPTIRRNDSGKIIFAYLDIELGGFALHLTT